MPIDCSLRDTWVPGARAAALALLLSAGLGSAPLRAQSPVPSAAPPSSPGMPPAGAASASPPEDIGHGDDSVQEFSDRDFLDRMQERLYRSVWRTAMGLDHLFGSDLDPDTYKHASGSLAPALLWNQVEGVSAQLRFRANLPLPRLNDRFSAFIGRVNPDEFVTERDQESGALRRQYGPIREDQTLLGISYREPPHEGSRFDAGAGVRVRFPMDPYVKGSYIYVRGDLNRTMFTFRQTVFWQNSEQFGTTTRMDVERLVRTLWLLHWTGSATLSQQTDGVRGYSAFDVLRPLNPREALAFEVGFDGETRNAVPMHDYGFKIAYRRQTYRSWLVLEYRTSLTWPKDEPTDHRRASIGVGLGFEILFGDQPFLARPTTF